jgi:pimeloyl-ACP methyl ester carboxylesterase
MFEQGLFKKKRKRSVSPVVAGVGALAAGAVAAAGSWIIYSKVAIDKNLPLPPALDAERNVFTSEKSGGISYYLDRSQSGRPLVLLHSINAAASAMEMSPLFAHYRNTRPVYAVDLPGFGFSERSNRRYSPELYTFAIVDFLTTQVEEPADVVALSLTGEFAAHAILINPDSFHSLTLISPTGLSRPDSDKGDINNRSHALLSFALWERPLYDLIATRRSIKKFLDMSFFDSAPPELVDYAYLTSHQPGAQHAPLYFLSGSLFTPAVHVKMYEKVETPTLVLYDRDPFSGFELLPDLVARNERWTAVRVPNTCGLPHWDQPSRTFDELDAFWSSISD